MSSKTMVIVGVQIAPFVTFSDGTDKHYEIQKEGANADTEGYAVYHRFDDGRVEHVADRKYEAEALVLAKSEAGLHGVTVELYPWQDVGLETALGIALDSIRDARARRSQETRNTK